MVRRPGNKAFGSETIPLELESDIYGYRAVGENDEELGVVQDYVFDENGRMRYLVIDTGLWFFSKRALVPVGLAFVDDHYHKVALKGLDRRLLEDLPDFESLGRLNQAAENELIRYYSELNNMTADSLFRVPERLRLLEDRLSDQELDPSRLWGHY